MNKLNQEIAAIRRSITLAEEQLIIAKSNDDASDTRFFENMIKKLNDELEVRLYEIGDC